MEEEKGFYSHGAVNKSFIRLTQQYLNKLKISVKKSVKEKGFYSHGAVNKSLYDWHNNIWTNLKKVLTKS